MGWMDVTVSNEKIVRLHFTDNPSPEDLKHNLVPGTDLTRFLKHELDTYFSGNLIQFTVPFMAEGTSFQQQVWQLLSEIQYGKTNTYTALTERIGNPLAIRAVAGAIAKNPLLVLIPCHRIIGSDGSLTGYAGGLERKQMLLKLEGHPVPGIQLSVFDSKPETHHH